MVDPGIFDLTLAERDIKTAAGFTTSLRADGMAKTPVAFWDFTVDGAPLFADLAALSPDGFDYVGVIQEAWPIETVAAIERLLGDAPGDLPDGRISLYVCPECGDLGCWAVTARVTAEDGVVIWQAIGWQADYDQQIVALGEDGAFPDVVFTRGSYEEVLRREMARVRPLVQGFEYPHQRDRRLRRERRGRLLRRLLPRR
jgi:hypothetical protein